MAEVPTVVQVVDQLQVYKEWLNFNIIGKNLHLECLKSLRYSYYRA